MKYTQDQMIRNYREADSRRREREAREQREHEQALEEAARAATRRAHNAEGRYDNILRNTKELPTEFMERVIGYMVRRTIEGMVDDRRVIDEMVREFVKRCIIRVDRYSPTQSVAIEVRNDGPHDPPAVTVSIPQFNLTQVLDDLTLTDLVGKVGPVVMPDKPIMYCEDSPFDVSVKYNEDDLTAPIKTKTI